MTRTLRFLVTAVTAVILSGGAAAVLLLSARFARADSVPPGLLWKWSQAPNLIDGWGVGSGLTAIEFDVGGYAATAGQKVVADDWRCRDGLPIMGIHWWGTYFGVDPDNIEEGFAQPVFHYGDPMTFGPQHFVLSVYADIPATQNASSHPGPRLWWEMVAAGDNVIWDVYAQGSDYKVFHYYYELSDRFEQTKDEIYWLSICGVDEVGLVPGSNQNHISSWGWLTARRPAPDNGLDPAVVITDFENSDFFGWNYTHWGSLYDDGGGIPMAFELSTIPEPGTLATMGTVVLVITGLTIRHRVIT